MINVQSENSITKIAQNIAQKMVLIIKDLKAKVQSFGKKALSYI
jgi:hypothetical protein